MPGSQTTNENTAPNFNSSNGNAISIASADAGTSPVQISLTASEGTLTLASTQSLTITSGTGANDTSVTVIGTISAINQALNGLPFTPTTNYAGSGYSRDHRSDCKQVVLALVLSREGFPLAHRTWAGNTQDLQTVKNIVNDIEARFGKSNRVWVMDRGMISKDSLAFLSQPGRRYLLSTRRHALTKFLSQLRSRRGWQRLPDNPEVEVKLLQRGKIHYLLARSKPRRSKERAMRRRQRRALAKGLKKLHDRVAQGRLKKRDKILEAIGRLKGRYPKAHSFVDIQVSDKPVSLTYSWRVAKFKEALARDGLIRCAATRRVGQPSSSGKPTSS